MFTTLNEIRKHEPFESGWKKLLQHLDKTKADDEPLSLLTILESNGLCDAVWALHYIEGRDEEIRLFACDCACSTLTRFENVYPDDMRPRRAIETASLYTAANTNAYSAAYHAAATASFYDCDEVERLFIKLCNGGYAEC